jgi:hypothetical protein
MYDTTQPEAIPADPQMVAGYVDGSFEWSHDEWLPFMSIPRVKITVEPFDVNGQPTGYPFGNWHAASVIDSEAGAFSILSAARFIPKRNGYRPHTATLYNCLDCWAQNRRYLRGLRFWLWVAWYWGRGVPQDADVQALEAELQLPPGVRLAAWQYESGARFDTSLVVADLWHASATS